LKVLGNSFYMPFKGRCKEKPYTGEILFELTVGPTLPF